ncbi:MAG: hypothetical protein ACE5J0_02350 [Candidatus Paceibacterales bacterium]
MNLDYFKWNNGYEIDGIWYPKVTAICRVIAKPGLERWLANQESFAAMQAKRKKITDWGKLVHNTIEKMLRGESPEINPAIQPSIDAFLNWLNSHKVKVFDIERRVLSKEHFYAGTLDVLGEVDGNFGILDLKTSKGIWDENFIQTAAYMQAHNEQALEKAKTHWILRIDQYQECNLCGAKRRVKGGEPEIKEGSMGCSHQWAPKRGIIEFKEVDSHQSYIEAFLTAKKLWEFSNRHWLSQVKNYPQKFKAS